VGAGPPAHLARAPATGLTTREGDDVTDRELLEKMLTAQVLTLAQAIQHYKERNGDRNVGDQLLEAIRLIAESQGEVIGRLLASAPPR
jgi:hypothetical protein